MQQIALTKASPGMVLAQAVCRQEGVVLVGEGLPLTEALIVRIRAAGIGSVWVEGNPLGAEGDVGNIRVIAEALPFLFRRHEHNTFMVTLRNVFTRHFAHKIAKQQALEDAHIANGKINAENPGEGAASEGSGEQQI